MAPVPGLTVVARRLDGQTKMLIVRRIDVALLGSVVYRLKLISFQRLFCSILTNRLVMPFHM